MRSALKGFLKVFHVLRICRWLRDGSFCFLDRVADVIRRVFRAHSEIVDKNRVQRILAIRLDRIGDLVLTTPAIRGLKETFPKAYLAVLVKKYTQEVVKGLPFIDEVIVMEDFKKRRDLAAYIKSLHFDVSLGFHPGFFINFLPWAAGIPDRVGYQYGGSALFLTHGVADDRYRRSRHEVESALEITALLGVVLKDQSLSIALQKESEIFAEDFFKKNDLVGKKVVMIHPGSRQPYIRWDKKRFSELADRLVCEKQMVVILAGSGQEAGLIDEVAGAMTEKSVAATDLSLSRLVSIMKRCVLFIGNSTGPMHIAAALKVPVVAIFGAAHPKDSYQEWGPWEERCAVVSKEMNCRHCHPGDCSTLECMEQIIVEDVYNAAVKLLTQ